MSETIKIHPYDLYDLINECSAEEFRLTVKSIGERITEINGHQYIADTSVPYKSKTFA